MLTNAGYFKTLLGFSPSSETVEAAMIDNDLLATDPYVKANAIALKTGAIAAMQKILSAPDTTEGTGETSISIRYDRNAIALRVKQLQEELETEELLKPIITSRRVW